MTEFRKPKSKKNLRKIDRDDSLETEEQVKCVLLACPRLLSALVGQVATGGDAAAAETPQARDGRLVCDR